MRPTITVVGRRLEPEHHRLRDLLARTAQPFEWIEAGTPEAQAALSAHDLAEAELPVVIDGEKTVEAATVERLAEAWQISAAPARRSYDLAIVGAGPAGLAAAVYSASDGLSTLVLERDVSGTETSSSAGCPAGTTAVTSAAGKNSTKLVASTACGRQRFRPEASDRCGVGEGSTVQGVAAPARNT